MWYLYRRGRIWWARRTVDGVKEYKSLQTDDRKVAEAKLRRDELAEVDPRHHAAHSTSLSDALDAVVKLRREQGRSAATLSMYDQKKGHLNRILGGTTALSKIDAAALDGYVSQRREEGAADPTIAKELSCLRGALSIARRHKKYPYTLDEVMPQGVVATSKARKTFLTPEQLLKLLAELSSERGAHVAFIVATGMRDSEAASAHRADVDLERWLVTVRGTKTEHAAAEIVVPPMGRALLAAALSSCADEGRLFTRWGNIRRDLHAACARAGVPAVTPNDLRRTCASWMVQAGTSTLAVSRVLRHADTRMVERTYGRTDTKSLRALVDAPFATVPQLSPTPATDKDQADAADDNQPAKTAQNGAQGRNRTVDTRIFKAQFFLGIRRCSGPDLTPTVPLVSPARRSACGGAS